MASYNIIPGTGNRYANPGNVNYRQQSGGQSRGFQNGTYGYWNYAGVGTNARFTPFSQQPIRTPLSVYNPAAYQRQQLTSQTQNAIDEARQANIDRYNEALGNLEGVGKQGRADINERFDSSKTAVQQNLVGTGLASSTIMPTMRQGVERERQGALNRLETDLARERNQVIQSRTDTGPNLEFLYRMMMGQGAGGY